ncbi:MAG: MerR family transcriptional regulator [Pseudomonadota bacterium]
MSHINSNIAEVLPVVPDKLYFTIGETSELCAIKPHVLRYWEQEFAQLKPTKRRGGRRYYQTKDIELIRDIRELLYLKGFTIAGAKQQIQVAKVDKKSEPPKEEVPVIAKKEIKKTLSKEVLLSIVQELEDLLEVLQG